MFGVLLKDTTNSLSLNFRREECVIYLQLFLYLHFNILIDVFIAKTCHQNDPIVSSKVMFYIKLIDLNTWRVYNIILYIIRLP